MYMYLCLFINVKILYPVQKIADGLNIRRFSLVLVL